MNKPEYQRISVRIPIALYNELVAAAENEGLLTPAFIRMALKRYMNWTMRVKPSEDFGIAMPHKDRKLLLAAIGKERDG